MFGSEFAAVRRRHLLAKREVHWRPLISARKKPLTRLRAGTNCIVPSHIPGYHVVQHGTVLNVCRGPICEDEIGVYRRYQSIGKRVSDIWLVHGKPAVVDVAMWEDVWSQPDRDSPRVEGLEMGWYKFTWWNPC